MTFEPTHRILYEDSNGTREWLVLLREDKSAVDEHGNSEWMLNEHGRWQHTGSLEIKPWPEGEMLVENLSKVVKVKKGDEPKHMPAGTVITLTRGIRGEWNGTCEAGGTKIERSSSGLMGIASKLCSDWFKARRNARDAKATAPTQSENSDG